MLSTAGSDGYSSGPAETSETKLGAFPLHGDPTTTNNLAARFDRHFQKLLVLTQRPEVAIDAGIQHQLRWLRGKVFGAPVGSKLATQFP
jgi:hypothetical protein